MNIRFIGPNLKLFPMADVSDGLVDVLLVSEKQREQFADYLRQLINEKPDNLFHPVQAKQVVIQSEKSIAHFDGTLIKVKRNSMIKIGVRDGELEFLDIKTED